MAPTGEPARADGSTALRDSLGQVGIAAAKGAQAGGTAGAVASGAKAALKNKKTRKILLAAVVPQFVIYLVIGLFLASLVLGGGADTTSPSFAAPGLVAAEQAGMSADDLSVITEVSRTCGVQWSILAAAHQAQRGKNGHGPYAATGTGSPEDLAGATRWLCRQIEDRMGRLPPEALSYDLGVGATIGDDGAVRYDHGERAKAIVQKGWIGVLQDVPLDGASETWATTVIQTATAWRLGTNYTGSCLVPPSYTGWRLYWSDEFTAASIDPAAWYVHSDNFGAADPYSLHCMTPANVSVAGGSAILTARKQKQTCYGTTKTYNYTSGMIDSFYANKFYPLYGRFEWRVRVPHGQGIWPGLWLRHRNGASTAEVDVAEVFHAAAPGKVTQTVHFPNTLGVNVSKKSFPFETAVKGRGGWHTFSVDILPVHAGDDSQVSFTFMVDGQVTSTYVNTNASSWTNGDKNATWAIAANLFVGGRYAGDPERQLGYFPDKNRCSLTGAAPPHGNPAECPGTGIWLAPWSDTNFEIDYVRVYIPDTTTPPGPTPTGSATPTQTAPPGGGTDSPGFPVTAANTTTNPSGDGTTVTVNGATFALTPKMLQNVAKIVKAGQDGGVPERGILIAVMTSGVETGWLNLASDAVPESKGYPNDGVVAGDHDSVGIMQQRVYLGVWGDVAHIMDPIYSAGMFYGLKPPGAPANAPPGLLGTPGWDQMPLGDAAQAVQVSAYPGRYAVWEDAARTAIQAASGIVIAGNSGCSGVGTVPGEIDAADTYRPVWLQLAGGALVADPRGYTYGQCTSYAAFMVATTYPRFADFSPSYCIDGKCGHFGNAATWDNAAQAIGIPVDSTPAVGSVGVRESGYAGHVVFVTKVYPDGFIDINEYNAPSPNTFNHRTHYDWRGQYGHLDHFIHFEKVPR